MWLWSTKSRIVVDAIVCTVVRIGGCSGAFRRVCTGSFHATTVGLPLDGGGRVKGEIRATRLWPPRAWGSVQIGASVIPARAHFSCEISTPTIPCVPVPAARLKLMIKRPAIISRPSHTYKDPRCLHTSLHHRPPSPALQSRPTSLLFAISTPFAPTP